MEQRLVQPGRGSNHSLFDSTASVSRGRHRYCAVTRFQHSIRKQSLEVEADTEALACALQSRIADINRQQLLPIIQRVFDERAVPGLQIKIAKLDVDLGMVPLARFEEVVKERLYRELHRAVET